MGEKFIAGRAVKHPALLLLRMPIDIHINVPINFVENILRRRISKYGNFYD